MMALCTTLLFHAGAPEARAGQLPEPDAAQAQEPLDRSLLGDLLGQLDLGSLDLGPLLQEEGGSAGSSSVGDILTLIGIGTRPLKDCKISPIKDQAYTGKAVTPSLTITYNGTRLKKNTDYTVKYTNNTKAGTASCTVTGQGMYSGTRRVSFKITKSASASGKSTSKSEKKTGKFTVKVTTSSYVFNGSEKKPSVKVTYKGKSVTSGHYTVTYKNNKNVGKATVTVKGKGEYKELTGEASFKITLKKTSLKTASCKTPGSADLSWTADPQSEGYQIQACTNKEFGSGVKKMTVAEGKTDSCQFEKLTGGKKYYFRIRSFKKVGSSNWYSEWSAARQVSVR